LKNYYEQKGAPAKALAVFQNKDNIKMLLNTLTANGIKHEQLTIKDWTTKTVRKAKKE
jgi:hypothetical protein